MNNLYKFKKYFVFGWELFKRSIVAGDKYATYLSVDRDKNSYGAKTLWVKGRIVGKNVTTGAVSPERVPGTFTEDRDHKYPAGRYEFECVEDSEWWCFPFKTKDDSPNAQAIRLSAGESIELSPGQRAVIVYGEALVDGDPVIDVPFSIQKDLSCVITAATQTYGFLIDRDK